ncbi:MAG: type II secretion system protein [Proteobacteria bacterium]|nr:type II secretion system protein [Pseudomonadota bacterium]
MKRSCLRDDHIIHDSRGFTLFEIVMTLLILAIAIVPMMNAFAPALLATSQGEEQEVLTGQARRTMNRLTDLDFRSLDANQGNPADLVALFGSQAEVDKENFVYLGTTYAPVVAIADASGGAGGLLEITVTVKTVRLQSLKANH